MMKMNLYTIFKSNIKSSQSGQVLVILILVTLVALTVGLAITQRSISDISISTQTEQSSRAFSAAEAGLEQAIALEDETGAPVSDIIPLTLSNQSSAQVRSASLPSPLQVLEYPRRGKADFAHFWLSLPSNNPSDQLKDFFKQEKIEVYFGISSNDPEYKNNDRPAIEVNIVTKASNQYLSKRFFYDSDDLRSNNLKNGFLNRSNTSSINCSNHQIYTIFSTKDSSNREFLCRIDIDLATKGVPVGTPILARLRILYSEANQPVALGISRERRALYSCKANGPYPGFTDCDLPPQVSIYNSVGTSGVTQRKLQLFRQKFVVPFYFDYAIFSTLDLTK